MPSPTEGGGIYREERRTPYAAIAFGVLLLMAAEGVVLYVFLRKPAPIGMVKPDRTDASEVGRSSAELLAPIVKLSEPVIVSVEERRGGATELRTAVLSVTIKIGKVEGREDEVLDVADLERNFVPKVKALLPWVRNELIRVASGTTVQDLANKKVKIASDLKTKLNDRLENHGAPKRIAEVLWDDFYFD
jgi:hypothetical protein